MRRRSPSPRLRHLSARIEYFQALAAPFPGRRSAPLQARGGRAQRGGARMLRSVVAAPRLGGPRPPRAMPSSGADSIFSSLCGANSRRSVNGASSAREPFAVASRRDASGNAARLRRNRATGRDRARFSRRGRPPEGSSPTWRISASFRRLTGIARNSAGGAGMRRARVSRTNARMCFSVMPHISAISGIEMPRFKYSTISFPARPSAGGPHPSLRSIDRAGRRAERLRRIRTLGVPLFDRRTEIAYTANIGSIFWIEHTLSVG
jgi:hypothetical protein